MSEKSEILGIRIEPEDKIRLEAQARNEGRTLNGHVRFIIRQWLNKGQKDV